MGQLWVPPPPRATREWLAEEYRLPEEGADLPGAYSPDMVPYLWGVFAALDDPKVKLIVQMKAAQIGWTFGLIGYLLKTIAESPTAIIGLFPKEESARKFMDEKFVPAARATPAMSKKLDVGTSRKNGNRALFKQFPGGYFTLVGSNSISNVKSTTAEMVVVEEPDDTNENIKEQGAALGHIRDRIVRWRRGKMILGGTPTVKGVSRVEQFIAISDQRVLPVQCHECLESHVLQWENVTWQERDEGAPHPVYGMAMPETALYACPHCGSAWDDWRRKRNVLQTVRNAVASGDPYCGWKPTVESDGTVVGFKELNELYACLPGSVLSDVVREYLESERAAETGNISGRIKFVNTKLARPYEVESETPDIEDLESRASDYPELTVPAGALVLTAGVDVQHDRLAVSVWGWGRGEEQWLVYWGEIYAARTTVDRTDPCWQALDEVLFTARKHQSGYRLIVEGTSIDASDGQTSDTVYWYVRGRQRRGVMAVKGDSHDHGKREIYSAPRKVDYKTKTKASKAGVQVFMVGTHKAKDLLVGGSGRITLTGHGPGRMHWYQDVRSDWYAQMTSEVKAPHRNMPGKLTWQLKAGARNEALDTAVYALHAARALRLHLWSEAKWDALERELAQADLFSNSQSGGSAPAEKPSSARNLFSGGKPISRTD
ncbi:phage terminase large subunit family protein [Spiribacter halobius]|uniref:phage terminase large subunit family protein n=1 Tax=Sediminicurvatus halobius TaxID=2182432 RepID=UPI00130491E1|nr:terminase gpA endonuclease subunit [Spiribacter halobius]UEX76803.1 phage terminase large subunit family protein [Spiribacter halobius]